MEPTQIIQRPVITEKTTWAAEQLGQYRFLVNPQASKPQIKQAIETLYEVRVEAVNTQVRKGKHFRTRYGMSRKSDQKFANVTLHPDDRIELY